MIRITSVLSAFVVGSFCLLDAHQPNLVMSQQSTMSDPVIVEKPEISKAYYGELNDAAEYFKVTLKETLSFYMNVLVPDIPVYRRFRFSVELQDSSGNPIYLLDSGQTTWKPFYEKYGKDNYLMGPEARIPLQKGTYYLRVFNITNQGRYVLATGEKESFPVPVIVRTIFVMPKLKKQFFNKE